MDLQFRIKAKVYFELVRQVNHFIPIQNMVLVVPLVSLVKLA